MNLSTKQKRVVLLPFALIISTIGVSSIAAHYLSGAAAYLTCFLFYWIVWCYTIPIFLLDRDKLIALYARKLPSPKWLAILFILMPFAGTIGQIFIPEIGGITITVLLVTIVASLINGPGEELFWRGLFVTEFSKNKWLGIVYPSICFGLWHFAPLSVSGLHQGWQLMVFGPMILGLCWGWIAQKSQSIFWISVAHILVNFFALIGRMFFVA